MARQQWLGSALGACLRTAAAVAVFGLVTACASKPDLTKALNPDPPSKMYADADRLLGIGKFEDAARKFEDLDRDHPYASESRRAMVMAAFSWYKSGKLPEAIAAAERYTTMHPGTKEAALAHHIIASAHFDEIKSPARDQTATRKALVQLKTIRARYPDSQYAGLAENRIRIAEDVLAANELTIGRYYLKNRNYVGAINRFKTVVAEYQTTPQIEEALARLTESYLALGVVPEAQAAAAVLGHNFPSSRWYNDSYALLAKQGVSPQQSSGSWIAQAWRNIAPGQPAQPANAPAPAKIEPPKPDPGWTPITPAPQAPQQKQAPADIPTASTTPRSKPPMGVVGAVAQ